jgi:hypothetical protein
VENVRRGEGEAETRVRTKLLLTILREHDLKVLSDENQGGSKLVSIDSFFFTV